METAAVLSKRQPCSAALAPGRLGWQNALAMSDLPHECLLALTTCPDAATAERVARALVEGGAAACVNILPAGRSVFRWQGELQTEAEHVLLVKTRRAAYAELERLLRETHPYELPELVAVPIVAGLSGYLEWVAASVIT